MEPQVVVAVVAPVVAFVAGMVVEDRVLFVPRVREFVASVKAKVAKVRDSVRD